MPTINIKGKDYTYEKGDTLNFVEGLIGLPKMRRAVLIPLPEYDPFCWLASLEDEKNRFIVVDPYIIFEDYKPNLFTGTDTPDDFDISKIKVLSIVKISSDWKQTSINLRSPIFIDSETRKGVQIILSDSQYKLAEFLPNIN